MAKKKAPAKTPAKKSKPSFVERMQALNPVRAAQRRTQQARNARINAATGFEEDKKPRDKKRGR